MIGLEVPDVKESPIVTNFLFVFSIPNTECFLLLDIVIPSTFSLWYSAQSVVLQNMSISILSSGKLFPSWIFFNSCNIVVVVIVVDVRKLSHHPQD